MARNRDLRGTEVIGLVAGREIRERLRSKAFFIGTGVLVIAILAIGVVSRITQDDGPRTVEVGVVGQADDPLASALSQAGGITDLEVTVTTYGDDDAARAAVEAEEVGAAVLPDERQLVFRGDVDADVEAVVQQAWATASTQQALEAAGLSADEVAQALSTPPLQASSLDEDEGPSGLAVLTGTLAAILLFISVQTFGTYVLTGVVEEKATAVVEVVLVRASADQLLAGKVLGIGVVALAQFATAVLAGLVSLGVSGTTVPGEIWAAVPMTLVWFILGYAFYSTLFALAGSLVSRQEDAQSAAAPITYGLVAAYMLIFILGYTPESTASAVLSLIPPITPLLMPMRMAAGAAPWWQVALGLVLLVASTWGVWKVSGRIYEQVLLRRGSRIGWRTALGLARR